MKRIFIAAFYFLIFACQNVESAPVGVESVRDVFGINAPKVDGDIDDKFRDRSSKGNLSPQKDVDLKDVAERTSGPRIIVKKFVFEGLKDHPSYGLMASDVEHIAERLRVAYMKEDRIGEDGYTAEEKDEIAGFLRDIGGQQSLDNITKEDLQALVDIVREQKQGRGLSFADLEEIANRITLYYRSKGFFLAKVQLPAQEVKDGVVTLSVMEGILGQVEVTGNERYRTSVIKAPAEPMIGKAVTSQETEEALYLLNDLPGLAVTGGFSAGDNPGETRLKLNVSKEKPYDILLHLDNHGARFTGKTRLYTSLAWHSPTGFGDELNLGFMRSEDIEGDNKADREALSDLAQFHYSMPLSDLRTSFALSAVRNQYDIVDEDGGLINALDLNGVNSSYSLRGDYKFVRTRAFNLSTGLALTDKTSEIKSDLLPSKTQVEGGEVNLYVDGLSEAGLRMLNTVNLIVQYGHFKNEVDAGADQEFYKVNIDTGSLFFIPIPFSDNYSRLATTTHSQYSQSPLPSFEQFAMGGASGVRAFQIEDFSADSSFYISNEWYFELPSWPLAYGKAWSDVFQAGLLLDFSYGVQNGGFIDNSGNQAGDEWARMSAIGLVLKAGWDDSFSSKISIATPLEAKSSLDPDSSDSKAKPLNDKPDSIEVFADLNFYF